MRGGANTLRLLRRRPLHVQIDRNPPVVSELGASWPGVRAAPVLSVHRCSISASSQLSLTVGAFGAFGAAREQPSENFGVSVTLLGGFEKFPGTGEAETTEDREQKAEVNKERRVEVVPVLFVWF